MKQFILFMLAALLGGLVAGGVLSYSFKPASVVPAATVSQPIHLTSYNNGQAPALPTADFNFRLAASLATPAVVGVVGEFAEDGKTAIKQLFGRQESPQKSSNSEGSGFFYTPNGHVLTNYHVIELANKISITTTDKRRYPATIVGFDKKTDIAVLKLAEGSFPYLQAADSDAAEVGDWVLAVGNPLNLNATVTAGIISAKGRSLQLLKDYDAIESFIQTDAAVNPGNSGGPLVDTKGNWLGINTAIASKSGLFEGYSFAIPANLAERIADDIIQYGSYQRAFLGVEIYALNGESASRLGVDISQGVVIETLVQGGSAQAAGLQANDIIVKANERSIREIADLTEIVGRAKRGEQLQLKIYRGNELKDVVVTMLAN